MIDDKEIIKEANGKVTSDFSNQSSLGEIKAAGVVADLENNEVDNHKYPEATRKQVIKFALGGDPLKHDPRFNDKFHVSNLPEYAEQELNKQAPLVELASLLEVQAFDDKFVKSIIGRCKRVIEVLVDDSSEEAKQALNLAVDLLDKILEETNTYDRQHYADLVNALGLNDSEVAWRIRNLTAERTERCKGNDEIYAKMTEVALLKQALVMDSEKAGDIIKKLVDRGTNLSGSFETKQQWESFKKLLDDWLSKHSS